MAHPMGESKEGVLRLDFDRRLKLEFHGSKVTSDAGVLPYRELDDAVGLSEIAGDVLTDTRRGRLTVARCLVATVPPVRFLPLAGTKREPMPTGRLDHWIVMAAHAVVSDGTGGLWIPAAHPDVRFRRRRSDARVWWFTPRKMLTALAEHRAKIDRCSCQQLEASAEDDRA